MARYTYRDALRVKGLKPINHAKYRTKKQPGDIVINWSRPAEVVGC